MTLQERNAMRTGAGKDYDVNGAVYDVTEWRKDLLTAVAAACTEGLSLEATQLKSRWKRSFDYHGLV